MDIKLTVYYLCILAGAVFSSFVGLLVGKKLGFSKKTAGIYICLALTVGIFSAFLMGQIQNFVMSLTGLPFYTSRMRIFGALLFTPFFLYLPVKYISGDIETVTDMLVPGMYLLLGFSKIGCAFYGCCYGIECSFGITTQFEEHKVFPVQLLESLFCFIIFGLFLYLVTKKKHRKGTAYPLSVILYGAVRFFAEYLRYYPEAERTYFFGVSFWQAVSVISVIFGVLWLIRTYYGKCRAEQKRMKPCKE